MATKKTISIENRNGISADKAIRIKLDKLTKNNEKALRTNVAKACIYYQGKWKHAISSTLFYNIRMGTDKPLVDTGAFLNSIQIDVSGKEDIIEGSVGSTISDPPYPNFLEFGTSKMKPHPTARPTYEAEKDNISKIIFKGVKSGFKDI